VVDFVRHWAERTGLSATRLLGWIGLSPRKYHRWRDRYGKANEHNALVPRDHWLEHWERCAIVEFARENPLEGYRRLAFMMIDLDVVAVSPSSVYRVLKAAGLIGDVTPKDKLEGRAVEVCRARDQKLEAVREMRRQERAAQEPTNPLATEESKAQRGVDRPEDKALPAGSDSNAKNPRGFGRQRPPKVPPETNQPTSKLGISI
jgi:hypothetical protein